MYFHIIYKIYYKYKVNDIDYHFSNVYQKLPGDGFGV